MEEQQPTRLSALTRDEIRQKINDSDIDDNQKRVLGALIGALAEDITLGDIIRAQTGGLDVDDNGAIVLAPPNQGTLHGIMGNTPPDNGLYTTADAPLGMMTVVPVNNNTQSDEELQEKINALQPGEHMDVGYPYGRNLLLPPTHVWLDRHILNAGFDIERNFPVNSPSEDIDGMIVVGGNARVLIGEGKIAVVGPEDNNYKITFYKSAKEITKKYRGNELNNLICLEKIAKQGAKLANQAEKIAKLEKMVEQLWYAPGSPGAAEAQTHFDSIKPSEK